MTVERKSLQTRFGKRTEIGEFLFICKHRDPDCNCRQFSAVPSSPLYDTLQHETISNLTRISNLGGRPMRRPLESQLRLISLSPLNTYCSFLPTQLLPPLQTPLSFSPLYWEFLRQKSVIVFITFFVKVMIMSVSQMKKEKRDIKIPC